MPTRKELPDSSHRTSTKVVNRVGAIEPLGLSDKQAELVERASFLLDVARHPLVLKELFAVIALSDAAPADIEHVVSEFFDAPNFKLDWLQLKPAFRARKRTKTAALTPEALAEGQRRVELAWQHRPTRRAWLRERLLRLTSEMEALAYVLHLYADPQKARNPWEGRDEDALLIVEYLTLAYGGRNASERRGKTHPLKNGAHDEEHAMVQAAMGADCANALFAAKVKEQRISDAAAAALFTSSKTIRDIRKEAAARANAPVVVREKMPALRQSKADQNVVKGVRRRRPTRELLDAPNSADGTRPTTREELWALMEAWLGPYDPKDEVDDAAATKPRDPAA